MDEALHRRREEVVKEHLESEAAQEFERTLATFEKLWRPQRFSMARKL